MVLVVLGPYLGGRWRENCIRLYFFFTLNTSSDRCVTLLLFVNRMTRSYWNGGTILRDILLRKAITENLNQA